MMEAIQMINAFAKTGDRLRCEEWVELMDRLGIGAFTIDGRRRITSFNRSAQALLGVAESAVIGRDCHEVFRGIPCYAQCPFEGKPNLASVDGDVEITDKKRIRHLVTRMSAPLYGPEGGMTGCLTILQDHSPIAGLIDRVRYEERSLKIILDNLDIGVFTVNRGGHITFFNTAAEMVSGYNRREVIGKHFNDILGGGDIHDLHLLGKSMKDGRSRTSRKGRMTTRDGETIPVRADYMALTNEAGEIVGGIATVKDLTFARHLDAVLSERFSFHQIIGRDPAMQQIFEKIKAVAACDATVLIEGATGTGKDMVAKAIHRASRRASKVLIKVNCAALPQDLLESELFGYAKGAFTGADRDKPGRFQEADGGTIFLDEIGDLPLALQAKLLRVLEDREFYPLGSRRITKVDVRIIAATNRGLDNLVANRQFREDLFYRLNVLHFELPLLKDRPADLPLLIRHIMRRLCAASEKRPPDIADETMEVLLNYDYPGNVRELENVLEHALIVCQEEAITPRHLPATVLNRMATRRHHRPTGRTGDDDAEKGKIIEALRKHDGHRERTAKALGMDRTTLWRKMKRYGIDDG